MGNWLDSLVDADQMTEYESGDRVRDGDAPLIASDVPSIARSPRAVVGFIGRTERGPVNEPALIRSYNHFRQVFGGHTPLSHLSYCVQQFFLHGGRNAVVVRIVNRANRALIRIPAGAEHLELEARQPGSREFLRASIDYDGVESNPAKFNLVVQRLARQGSEFVEDQEIFAGVSVQASASRYLTRVLARSRLVTLRGSVPEQRPDATSPRFPGEPIPYLEIGVRGTDGSELTDYDIIGSDRDKSGLWSLDAYERIDMVCLPSPPGRDHGTTTFLAAERYCARRRAILIWDPPHSWITADTAILGARESVMRSINAFTYFPRLRARVDRVGLPSVLPACGAIAGILASRSDNGEWEPGSDTDPALKISLAPTLEVDDVKRASLHRAGVNVLAPTGFGGSVLTGNVTLASPGSVSMLWQDLDKRRLALFILNSIESAGDQAIARSREPAVMFEERVGLFLRALERRGAFANGARGESWQRAWFIKRSSANQQQREQRMRVGFLLHKASEFLVYELSLSPAGCRFLNTHALEQDQLTG
jgi:hypothetical protein